MQGLINISLEVANSVATLTLNRPEKLNSLTQHMHAELCQAFDVIESEARSNNIRVLLLTGSGRAFCAGQDLNERRRIAGAPPPNLGQSLQDNYNPLIQRISLLPLPVLAAVNGIAAGSGANLALACDLVVAARSAVFSQPFIHLGLIPDAGGTWALPRLVGMARAKAMTFLGERITADEAERWGLIWKVVDDETLSSFANTLARDLATKATRSFALQKAAYAASSDNGLAAQLTLEAQLQTRAGETSDYVEGVNSFFDKREPRFTGR
ncbi:MAG: 2-(1,2-epoxy-1,2-dihydrophenyl)acetyl-CoA isomerase PaaG [Pseudomonadota bacterium]|nr:2-(1,2-epoxy-1,2-dihydrophenyl)acetyl-CoA isomerase PaaG [Pseudomonadota bacterium]